MSDNLPQWVIGTLITGIITAMFIMFGFKK